MTAGIPAEFDDPAVLAYLAALLAWREGDERPIPPTSIAGREQDVVAQLNDERIRAHVVERLSVLVPAPNRKLRRKKR